MAEARNAAVHPVPALSAGLAASAADPAAGARNAAAASGASDRTPAAPVFAPVAGRILRTAGGDRVRNPAGACAAGARHAGPRNLCRAVRPRGRTAAAARMVPALARRAGRGPPEASSPRPRADRRDPTTRRPAARAAPAQSPHDERAATGARVPPAVPGARQIAAVRVPRLGHGLVPAVSHHAVGPADSPGHAVALVVQAALTH